VSKDATRLGRGDRLALRETLRGRRLGIAFLGAGPRALLAFLAFLDPSPLHGAESVSRPIAEVTVAAKDEDVDRFLEGMREPLEELGLTVRASGAGEEIRPLQPGAPKTRVRVVVDARPSDHVDVLVWVAPSVRTAPVQRRVPRGSSTAVVIEDVAYAVRATVESLLAELTPPAPAGSTSPGGKEATTIASTRGEPAHFGLDVGGFAGVRGVAASAPAFGGGLALDFAFFGRRPGRPGLYLAASVYAPVDTSTTEVTLETMMYSARAISTFEVARLGPLRLAFGAGAGADLLHAQGHADATSVVVDSSATLIDPVIEAQLLVRLVVRGAGLFLGFDLDYDLNPDRFTQLDRSGVSSNVLAEWTVRPAAILGVCLPVAGVSACREIE
jgi:hypothetical protein